MITTVVLYTTDENAEKLKKGIGDVLYIMEWNRKGKKNDRMEIRKKKLHKKEGTN